MNKIMKRLLCLTLLFTLTFSTAVFAEEGPDPNPVSESDFNLPSDTSFDDTVWTIEREDGTEELYNPNLRWDAIGAVAMSLDFQFLGKAVFATSVDTYDNSYDIKIVTKLQSYRDGEWKTLYTKTKTSTVASTMISGSYYVTKGYKYRTRNAITVYNSKGTVIETDTLNCTRTYN